MAACKSALAHSRKNAWWQAGNACHQACSLWKGNLPADTFTNEFTASWENILLETFAEVSLTWGTHLAAIGRMEEAIQVIENVLHSNGLEERAVVLLCKLYKQNNMPLKVRKTLERYRSALEKIDYAREEIEEILSGIMVPTP